MSDNCDSVGASCCAAFCSISRNDLPSNIRIFSSGSLVEGDGGVCGSTSTRQPCTLGIRFWKFLISPVAYCPHVMSDAPQYFREDFFGHPMVLCFDHPEDARSGYKMVYIAYRTAESGHVVSHRAMFCRQRLFDRLTCSFLSIGSHFPLVEPPSDKPDAISEHTDTEQRDEHTH